MGWFFCGLALFVKKGLRMEVVCVLCLHINAKYVGAANTLVLINAYCRAIGSERFRVNWSKKTSFSGSKFINLLNRA